MTVGHLYFARAWPRDRVNMFAAPLRTFEAQSGDRELLGCRVRLQFFTVRAFIIHHLTASAGDLMEAEQALARARPHVRQTEGQHLAYRLAHARRDLGFPVSSSAQLE